MSLEVVINGQVLEVTINRPKANSIDMATSQDLGKVFQGFMSDSNLRVAILTGAGSRFFCAGWDLKAANEGEAFESDYGVGGFGGISELTNRPKPIIAAINGLAVGGGFEIALAADLVIAAEHAEFFLPEATLGIIADNATVRLPRVVPPNIARELLIGGRKLSALEALNWGVVNQVVEGSELINAARKMAKTICQAAPLSVTAVLELTRSLGELAVLPAIESMRLHPAYLAVINSVDATEGTKAFIEKRPPKWQGS